MTDRNDRVLGWSVSFARVGASEGRTMPCVLEGLLMGIEKEVDAAISIVVLDMWWAFGITLQGR